MATFKTVYGTPSDLSALIGITPARISQLTSKGIFTAENGKYDLRENIKSFYMYKLAPAESVDYMTEKALHEKAKRQLAEMEVRKRANLLHDARDVEMVLTDMLSNLRAQLLAIPAKMAGTLENRDKGFIYGELEREIKERLTDLSDYNPKMFDSDSEWPDEEEDGE